MRLSREVSKERLLEIVTEAIEAGDEDMSVVTSTDLAESVTDEVWQLLGELDDEDDLGILKLKEETPEDGG